MKRLLTILGLLVIILGLIACGVKEEVAPDKSLSATATAQAAITIIPDDVPIPERVEELKVTADGTYISFLVVGTVEDIATYYKEQMVALSWETRSKTEGGFGDSITLLRYKEDKNISITVQIIPSSDKVRVLITLIPK